MSDQDAPYRYAMTCELCGFRHSGNDPAEVGTAYADHLHTDQHQRHTGQQPPTRLPSPPSGKAK